MTFNKNSHKYLPSNHSPELPVQDHGNVILLHNSTLMHFLWIKYACENLSQAEMHELVENAGISCHVECVRLGNWHVCSRYHKIRLMHGH